MPTRRVEVTADTLRCGRHDGQLFSNCNCTWNEILRSEPYIEVEVEVDEAEPDDRPRIEVSFVEYAYVQDGTGGFAQTVVGLLRNGWRLLASPSENDGFWLAFLERRRPVPAAADPEAADTLEPAA